MNKLQRMILILIGLIVASIGIYVLVFFSPNKKEELVATETIKYGYVLYHRDNASYKEIFNNLKETLNEENINYEKYAEYISELFVSDFYTLENKNSKDDVGGLQYIYASMKDNFILKASNTIYKYIGVTDSKDLPEVSSVELVSVESINYTIDDVSYEGYKVKITWEYKKDLEYDNSGEIILIKEDNQLYIVEKN